MNAVVLFQLLGGVGLLLLGMHLMTDGLRVAAGGALRDILARWTGTRLRGVLSGTLITSLVQSSSAVTVAAIGFVNAGLLTLSQAIAVIYGSNVGTTATAWIVAAVGLQVNVKALALPLVGVGMGLRIVGRGGRLAHLAGALVGFGVFFLGIDVMKSGFGDLGGGLQLDALIEAGSGRAVVYVGIGFLLTLLLQSSSAAIALILTAAAGGAVPLGAGAALVIGANIGTTSTAALAVIGATSNAKRVAAGHIAFNLVTGAVAMALLPLLLLAIVEGRTALRLDDQPAAVLAAFHTVFNLFGVLLLLPLTGILVRFLEARFLTQEEEEAKPRYLDRNVLTTPILAVHALVMELSRVGAIARRMARGAITRERGAELLAADRRTLDSLIDSVGDFAGRLQRTALPAKLDEALPTLLRVSRHYSELADLAQSVAAEGSVTPLAEPASAARIAQLEKEILDLIDRAGIDRPGYSAPACSEALVEFQSRYQDLKAHLLRAGANGEIPVRALVDELDRLSLLHHIAKEAERGARFLAEVAAQLESRDAEDQPSS